MPVDKRTSYGLRRRYRGKMVNPSGSPRSHSGSKVSGGSPPFYEVGAGDQSSQSCGKGGKGRRVSLPQGRLSIKGEFGSWA